MTLQGDPESDMGVIGIKNRLAMTVVGWCFFKHRDMHVSQVPGDRRWSY